MLFGGGDGGLYEGLHEVVSTTMRRVTMNEAYHPAGVTGDDGAR